MSERWVYRTNGKHTFRAEVPEGKVPFSVGRVPGRDAVIIHIDWNDGWYETVTGADFLRFGPKNAPRNRESLPDGAINPSKLTWKKVDRNDALMPDISQRASKR